MGRGIDPDLETSGGTNALGSESKPWTSAQITTVNATTVNATTVNATTVNATTTNSTTVAATDLTADTVNGHPARGIYFNDFKGFKQQVTGNAAISITANNDPFSDNSSALSLTIDASTTGANALDTGTIAASTWYYTYIIFGTSGTAALLSTVYSGSPTMPTGYTEYIRVGAVRTNTSGYLFRTIQRGREVKYIIDGTILTTNYTVVASGTSSLASVSLAGYIPTNVAISGWLKLASSSSSYTAYIAGNANGVSLLAASASAVTDHVILESSAVYYYSTDSTSVLYVMGWADNLS